VRAQVDCGLTTVDYLDRLLGLNLGRHGTVHTEEVERGAARVARSRGTPAAGLRPRPAREKDFPSNLLLD
jgi:hypothetical protein